ncbi:hypothetical protein [Bacillus niameyensis]|uniref:hypothetical protein n=1 Tax=Bacillus niameyensis TaxID=1522308 RepID=UPI00078268FE|nr:hypothetical protein [Bacillus niameyensis]
MKKLLTNAVFTIAIILFFISLTISFVLIQIIINKNLIIDQDNINIVDILIKSSFALIGSTLSGFVAFLIFFLGDRKNQKEIKEHEEKLLSIIKDESKNNLRIYSEIAEIFKSTPVEKIAEILHKDPSRIKEMLFIYFIKIDFSILDSALKEIPEKDYLENIANWRRQKSIHNYLELLLTKVEDKENTIILLMQIENGINQLK